MPTVGLGDLGGAETADFFVTGFFGMNLKNLPFAESEEGVVYATIVCIFAAGLVLLLMRRWGLTGSEGAEESRPRGSEPPAPPADTSSY